MGLDAIVRKYPIPLHSVPRVVHPQYMDISASLGNEFIIGGDWRGLAEGFTRPYLIHDAHMVSLVC